MEPRHAVVTPIRITFVCPPLGVGGGLRVIATYAERLRRRGYDLLVVAPACPRPGLRAVARSLVRGQGWPQWTGKQLTHFDKTSVPCRVLDRCRPVRDADVPDADVVIATWWETAEWVAALSPRKGAKAYFLQHHEVFAHLPIARVEATWRMPFHKIAVCQWLVDLARDRYGDSRASLVPNAVDHGLFHAPPRGKATVPTIGLMYSSVSFKGADISLRAFSLCARRAPGLRLVAFGSEPISPSLPLPPGAEYHRLPPQDELRHIYSRCDVWLFGSRSEGFGLPILEAMACRTPVVGTPAGAAPELLAEGGGILVRPEDPADMARAIEQVVTTPDEQWRRMSEAAFATASRYNWEDATDRFEQALFTAIERAARGEIAGGSAQVLKPVRPTKEAGSEARP